MTSDRVERLADLLDRALSLETEERRRFLDAVRREDVELAEELDSLLTAHEAPGDLDALAAQVFPAVLDDLAQRLAGDVQEPTVGRYHLLERLGGGGMGQVYRARDLTLDRAVALKFLPFHLTADAAAREGLRREARAASALDHPNICVVHEIGASEPTPDDAGQGRLYIAMTYYAGETLKQKIARGPLPLVKAVEYARQAADGLEAAHRAGIVHRDIKPANLMITDRDLLKILDFGVARLAGMEMAQDGITAGTLAYMSPEQTRGEAVDAHSDVWSLGVVLYEMLTGVRPFQAVDEAALFHAIRHDEPRPLRQLRADVPAALEQMVCRCLHKEAAERYGDAGQLLVDLTALRWVDGPPRAPRRALTTAASAVMLVAVMLGVAWMTVRRDLGIGRDANGDIPPAAATPRPFDTATEAHRNPAAYDLYLRAIAQSSVNESGNRTALELLTRSIELDSTYAPAFTALGFHAYQLHAIGIEPREHLERAERAFATALSLDPREFQALSYQALLFIASGRLEEAITPLRRALAIQPDDADAYISLGHVYRNAGLLDESARSFERARFLDPKNRRLPSAGSVYHYLGRYDDALEAYGLEPYAPRAQFFKGLVLFESGRPDAARQSFEAVVTSGAAGGPLYLLAAEALLAHLDGARDRALDRVRELERRAAVSGTDGEAPYAFARLYALFGDRAGALRMFESAVDLGFFAYPFIAADPLMAAVRDDAAFQRILAAARTRHEAFRALVAAGGLLL